MVTLKVGPHRQSYLIDTRLKKPNYTVHWYCQTTFSVESQIVEVNAKFIVIVFLLIDNKCLDFTYQHVLCALNFPLPA